MNILPKNVSTYGQEIDSLFWLITTFALIAFVISLFVLIYPLFKYRQRAGVKAEYFTGEKKTHFKWVAIALIALALSDFIIMYAEHDAWVTIEGLPAQQDFHVGVTGRQWNWIFTYPGPDGKLGTADDVVVDEQNSELHVPVNKNIIFDLRARDVVHSFFIVNTRLKQDALPGRVVTRWFNITVEGKYDISCSQICGVLHAKMRNYVVAESQEKFDAYIKALYDNNKPKI